MHIFITANSPGELYGWVYPVAKELKKRKENPSITLVLTPCQYASGTEHKVVESWPEIDQVVKPAEYIKYILFGKRSFTLKKNEAGVVVFLGGDPLHALLLSRRLKLPAIAYLSRPKWKSHFKKFMLKNTEEEKKFKEKRISPHKIAVVGDLSLDRHKINSMQNRSFEDLDFSQPLILFLPGSRPVEINYMIPFYLKVAYFIKEKIPQTKFFMLISSFICDESLINILKKDKMVQKHVIQNPELWRIILSSELEVLAVKKPLFELPANPHLALTIPGTNNIELACLGVPMIVILPLDKAELVPLDGVLGLISPKVPLFKLIKRKIVLHYNKKTRFVALPNIRAGKEVVPEIRGIIKPKDAAKKAVEMLKNPHTLKKISFQLKELTKERGAAEKMADLILESVAEGKR